MSAPAPLGPELRRLAVPVYLPWAASALGAGVMLPVFPLYLKEVGLSPSLVGLVTAAAGLGTALGGLPASALSERWGTDRLLAVALVMTAASAALLGVTEAAVALIVLQITSGIGLAGVVQSRQLVVVRSTEVRLRGRVNAWVGGQNRLMFVVGPLLGGWVYSRYGAEPTFLLAGVFAATGLLWATVPEARDATPVSTRHERLKVWPSLWRHRRRLLRAGMGPMLIMAARRGRYVIIPLIGADLELDAAAVGVLVAAGTAADFILFPLAGYVMDRWGRLMSMVPAFSLMALGLLFLGLADTAGQAVVAGIVIGVGNGLSSGSLLTLGIDLAPPEEPGPFIAGYHTVTGAGSFAGPLLVGWVADSLGLGASAIALAGVLAIGVGWIALVIGETGVHVEQT
jgi:MFS family permease